MFDFLALSFASSTLSLHNEHSLPDCLLSTSRTSSTGLWLCPLLTLRAFTRWTCRLLLILQNLSLWHIYLCASFDTFIKVYRYIHNAWLPLLSLSSIILIASTEHVFEYILESAFGLIKSTTTTKLAKNVLKVDVIIRLIIACRIALSCITSLIVYLPFLRIR